MEKVLGIGGFFFRSKDPSTLASWYDKHLGISPIPESDEANPWSQEEGPTAFAPFSESTEYFGDLTKSWMINFRVRNLDAMVAQLKLAGVSVSVDEQEYPHGRFAKLRDPEGNPIELWESKAK